MSDFNIVEVKKDPDAKQYFFHDKCDIYDYCIAAGCGAIAGCIDVFLVGSPKDSKLQSWTDAQVNNVVRSFSKLCGWKPGIGKEQNTSSAIAFLEKKFRVNYDQRHTGDVGGAFDMSIKNHHMKSLAHSPDIVGLFFSILNQFTSTSSFLSNGKLITIQTDTYELRGGNFIAKLFCGIANWFGHLMSDIAGSSGSKERGEGIVIPFYELFQFCNFGKFNDGNNNLNTLDVIATKVFQEGYDARFGLTMAIPVVVCDLSIKLIWAIKHYFYHKKPLNECIPNKRHDDLRVMLIVGDGVLCFMDGLDASRYMGNTVEFLLHLNIFAWLRLIYRILREVCIRLGISFPLQKQIDAFKVINEQLIEYLTVLYSYDLEAYQKEIEKYYSTVGRIEKAKTSEQLNQVLKEEYENLGMELPYKGTLDEFMNDPTQKLVFK